MTIPDEFSIWKCPHCGTENDHTTWRCFKCDKKKEKWSTVKKIFARQEKQKEDKISKERQKKIDKLEESSPNHDSTISFDFKKIKRWR
ncbi:MAG TPA: hypothetical protein VEU72_09345 [Nitrosopumilaceae archaeon]|nr:hypothetical protein [Nitrosopumilaceae archaeon]